QIGAEINAVLPGARRLFLRAAEEMACPLHSQRLHAEDYGLPLFGSVCRRSIGERRRFELPRCELVAADAELRLAYDRPSLEPARAIGGELIGVDGEDLRARGEACSSEGQEHHCFLEL